MVCAGMVPAASQVNIHHSVCQLLRSGIYSIYTTSFLHLLIFFYNFLIIFLFSDAEVLEDIVQDRLGGDLLTDDLIEVVDTVTEILGQ